MVKFVIGRLRTISRLCLHSSRQQSRLEVALGLQPLCRLSTDRYLARCELDIPVLGSVLLRTAARGKADVLPK